MIYLNGKEWDMSNTDPNYEFALLSKDFHAYIDELKERFGDTITYITRQRPKRDPKTGNLRPVPLKSWPKEQTGVRMEVAGKDRPIGPFAMVWNQGQVVIDKNRPILDEKNFIVREGEMTVNLNSDPDFAYFLQYHNVVRRGEFFIYDPARTATEKATRYKREQKVRDLLFSEYSPLHKNFDNMKMVARRWGLYGIDKLTPDQLSVELFEKVVGNEEAKKRNPHLRGIKEFLQDTQLGAGVKAGELMARALESQVLKFNQTHSEFQIIYPGRQAGTPLLTVPPDKINMKEDFLIDAMVLDDQLMRKVENVLGVEPEESNVAFKIEDLETYKYQELQTIASSFGIKAIGKKMPQLKEEIKEAYQAQ